MPIAISAMANEPTQITRRWPLQVIVAREGKGEGHNTAPNGAALETILREASCQLATLVSAQSKVVWPVRDQTILRHSNLDAPSSRYRPCPVRKANTAFVMCAKR